MLLNKRVTHEVDLGIILPLFIAYHLIHYLVSNFYTECISAFVTW